MANNFTLVIHFDNASRHPDDTMQEGDPSLRKQLIDLGGFEVYVKPGWDWKFGTFAHQARIRHWKFADAGSRDTAKALVDTYWGTGGDAPAVVDPLSIINLDDIAGIVVTSGTYYLTQEVVLRMVPLVYGAPSNSTYLGKYDLESSTYTDSTLSAATGHEVVQIEFARPTGAPLVIPADSVVLKGSTGTEYPLTFSEITIEEIGIPVPYVVGSDLKVYPFVGYPSWEESYSAGAI